MAAKAAAEKIEFSYEGTNRGGAKVKGELSFSRVSGKYVHI